ncbi:MAG: DUF1926 domain-containing protein, partial [Planctomycetes bacterium]|nr:DUF1926 domain-containing protein [Planctomycetota bacterium]
PPKTGADQAASIHDLVLFKEKDLDKLLIYDWHERLSLVDHFYAPGATLELVERERQTDLGDFAAAPYEHRVEGDDAERRVMLARTGTLRLKGQGGAGVFRERRVRLEKTIRVAADISGFDVDYQLENLADEPLTVLFGCEWNFAMLAGDAFDRYYLSSRSDNHGNLNSRLGLDAVTSFGLRDEWDQVGARLEFEAERPAAIWTFPIKTVSQSEGGFEGLYQSSAVIPHWRLTLAPGKPERLRMRLALEFLPPSPYRKQGT